MVDLMKDLASKKGGIATIKAGNDEGHDTHLAQPAPPASSVSLKQGNEEEETDHEHDRRIEMEAAIVSKIMRRRSGLRFRGDETVEPVPRDVAGSVAAGSDVKHGETGEAAEDKTREKGDTHETALIVHGTGGRDCDRDSMDDSDQENSSRTDRVDKCHEAGSDSDDDMNVWNARKRRERKEAKAEKKKRKDLKKVEATLKELSLATGEGGEGMAERKKEPVRKKKTKKKTATKKRASAEKTTPGTNQQQQHNADRKSQFDALRKLAKPVDLGLVL